MNHDTTRGALSTLLEAILMAFVITVVFGPWLVGCLYLIGDLS